MTSFESSGFVRRPEVGELGEQIVVGAYPVLRDLPICEDSQEGILDVFAAADALNQFLQRTAS